MLVADFNYIDPLCLVFVDVEPKQVLVRVGLRRSRAEPVRSEPGRSSAEIFGGSDRSSARIFRVLKEPLTLYAINSQIAVEGSVTTFYT